MQRTTPTDTAPPGDSPPYPALVWLAICTPNPDAASLAGLAARLEVDGEPSWLEEALREDLGPLLYWRLTGAPHPVKLPDRIRHAFWRTFARESLQTRSVIEVLSALGSVRVAAAPLGPTWLAEEVYPHSVLRPHGELEFLVSPVELRRAKAAMVGLGFRSLPGKPGETSCVFERPDRSLPCRLHWALGRNEARFPEAEELLAEASPVEWRESSCLELPAYRQLALLLARLSVPEARSPALLPMLDVPWSVCRFGREALERALTAASVYAWGPRAARALALLRETLAWDLENPTAAHAIPP